MVSVLDKLLGGDLRSIGNANEVVSDIIKEPALFKEVFYLMKSDNPLIRMRSADVIEKVSKIHPEYLIPYKKELIDDITMIEQQEVRWHVALMFTHLEFTELEKPQVIDILLSWIEKSKSKIVKVNSLQALANIGERDKTYRNRIIAILEEILESGSPAMIARSKKLISKLKKLG